MSEPTDGPGSTGEPFQLHPAFLATLVAVPVAVIIGFIAYAAIHFSGSSDEPTPIDSYGTGPEADRCAAFIAALPDQLGEFGDKSVDGTTVRWSKDESEPVVLRCGTARPDKLAPTSGLQVINPVQWFLTDSIEDRGQAYVSVDHRPYVAVWVPVGAGNAPITDISALIAENLPRSPLDFG
ncbi:DUF3515 domain-containing protein [Gordonia shandongensis]|uniref:DUF3515 domain-containing protein n=1 Tax=Gordonia shandongensis TaxID=376351 RepID=UPI000412255A|nr:DUF3515 domain-containing protein [Gordonia shandongensis]